MPEILHNPAATPGETGSPLRNLVINSGLLVLSAVFFTLPQPNILSVHGFPIFAWVAFVPAFVLIRRVSFRASFIWGALYGVLSYCFFTYWLAVFHPLAMYVIAALYCIYYALAVPCLKLADMLFPRKGYVVQWLVWIGYEYLKTLGFNGYSYGVIGYSLWTWPVFIQISAIFGVWGVSALVVFPSAWIAGAIKPVARQPVRQWLSNVGPFFKQNRIPAALWVLFLVFTLGYGLVSPVDYSQAEQFTIALIQPNSDPWHGGMPAYRRDLRTLMHLSNQALESDKTIDLVVWPETAFIPRIDWHYRYREDRQYFDLVHQLLLYIDSAPVPFLLGNDDAFRTMPKEDGEDRLDYNAALLFRPGFNVVPPVPERYWKMHLVPFTEHFPYRSAFPWVYDLLIATDTHFWEKGTDPTVFKVDTLQFSTPICFEDTFGYISRRFVNQGARAIINLTNDAWAKSPACQYQHLSMALFRSVENRVPVIRSTASGQTAIIDPNGKIVSMADPFVETALIGSIPVLQDSGKTPYRIWGDLWGMIFAGAAFLALVSGLARKARSNIIDKDLQYIDN